jgi:hypothetical protein
MHQYLSDMQRAGKNGDVAKISFMLDFVAARAFAPTLTFAAFTSLRERLTDDQLCPGDVLDRHCPRRASVAEERGVPKWSSRHAAEILALYCEGVDAMVTAGQADDIPSFDAFLASVAPTFRGDADASLTAASNGDADESAAIDAAVTHSDIVTPEPAAPVVVGATQPSAPSVTPATTRGSSGYWLVYTGPDRRQRRCRVVQTYNQEVGGEQRTYYDVQTEDGELFSGVAASACTALNPEESPVELVIPVENVRRQQLPGLAMQDYGGLLASRHPVAGKALGEVLYQLVDMELATGCHAIVQLVNGQTGPYVDAYVLIHGNPPCRICEVSPRRVVAGRYVFHEDGFGPYALDLSVNSVQRNPAITYG